ncbi:hypothetical protein [Chryseobacterium jejuense]|uniref:hypothetical protein n=1 Tax=Chryseobacterium jejuense TaxID=445960 RepID=UPI001AE3202B|nr:hypothetical protein [Chryseobacterium jejuense]MBP2616647.1 sulfur carrier protein ThiS [Chryseobacterium jejuense]
MKIKLLFTLLVSFNFCTAQINIDHIDFQKDSIPKVINNTNKKPLLETLELNGKLLPSNTIFGLDPDRIESVTRKSVSSNEEKIIVKTKTDYTPKLISLIDLLKETNLNLKNFIIFIDGKPIDSEFDKTCVDKDFILQIKAENIQSDGKQDVVLVNIFTKSKKNIDKSKVMLIK